MADFIEVIIKGIDQFGPTAAKVAAEAEAMGAALDKQGGILGRVNRLYGDHLSQLKEQNELLRGSRGATDDVSDALSRSEAAARRAANTQRQLSLEQKSAVGSAREYAADLSRLVQRSQSVDDRLAALARRAHTTNQEFERGVTVVDRFGKSIKDTGDLVERELSRELDKVQAKLNRFFGTGAAARASGDDLRFIANLQAEIKEAKGAIEAVRELRGLQANGGVLDDRDTERLRDAQATVDRVTRSVTLAQEAIRRTAPVAEKLGFDVDRMRDHFGGTRAEVDSFTRELARLQRDGSSSMDELARRSGQSLAKIMAGLQVLENQPVGHQFTIDEITDTSKTFAQKNLEKQRRASAQVDIQTDQARVESSNAVAAARGREVASLKELRSVAKAAAEEERERRLEAERATNAELHGMELTNAEVLRNIALDRQDLEQQVRQEKRIDTGDIERLKEKQQVLREFERDATKIEDEIKLRSLGRTGLVDVDRSRSLAADASKSVNQIREVGDEADIAAKKVKAWDDSLQGVLRDFQRLNGADASRPIRQIQETLNASKLDDTVNTLHRLKAEIRDLGISDTDAQALERFFDEAIKGAERLQDELQSSRRNVVALERDTQKFSRTLQQAGFAGAAAKIDVLGNNAYKTAAGMRVLEDRMRGFAVQARGIGDLKSEQSFERLATGFERAARSAERFESRVQRGGVFNRLTNAAIGAARGMNIITTETDRLRSAVGRANGGVAIITRTFQVWLGRLAIGITLLTNMTGIIGPLVAGIGSLAGGVASLVGVLGELSGVLAALPSGFAAFAGSIAAIKTVLQPGGILAAVQGIEAARKSQVGRAAGGGTSGLSDQRSQVVDAREAVKDAQRNVVDAEISLHNLRVQNRQQEESAELQLQEARLRTAQSILEAERSLVETRRAARLEERFAREDVQNAKARVVGLRAEGASADVIAGAQADVRENQRILDESRIANARKVGDAEQQVNDARKQGALDVLQAQRNLQNTIINNAAQEQDAQRRVADSIRAVGKAQRNLVEQQKDVTDAMNGTGAAASTFASQTARALAGLDPSARRLVFQILDLKDGFKELTASTRDRGYEIFSNFLTFVNTHLPQVASVMNGFAGAVEDVADRFFKFVETPEVFQRLQTVFHESTPIVDRFGQVLITLVDIFTKIAIAAAPFTNFLTQGIVDVAKFFDNLVTESTRTGGFQSFLRSTEESLKVVIDLIKDFGGLVKNVFLAAAPAGREILGIFDGWIESLEKVSGSALGRVRLNAFFQRQIPVLREMGRLLAAVGGAILDVNEAFTNAPNGGKSALEEFIIRLRTGLVPFLRDFLVTFGTGVGKSFLNFIAGLGNVALAIGKVLAPVSKLLDIIGFLANGFADALTAFDSFSIGGFKLGHVLEQLTIGMLALKAVLPIVTKLLVALAFKSELAQGAILGLLNKVRPVIFVLVALEAAGVDVGAAFDKLIAPFRAFNDLLDQLVPGAGGVIGFIEHWALVLGGVAVLFSGQLIPLVGRFAEALIAAGFGASGFVGWLTKIVTFLGYQVKATQAVTEVLTAETILREANTLATADETLAVEANTLAKGENVLAGGRFATVIGKLSPAFTRIGTFLPLLGRILGTIGLIAIRLIPVVAIITGVAFAAYEVYKNFNAIKDAVGPWVDAAVNGGKRVAEFFAHIVLFDWDALKKDATDFFGFVGDQLDRFESDTRGRKPLEIPIGGRGRAPDIDLGLDKLQPKVNEQAFSMGEDMTRKFLLGTGSLGPNVREKFAVAMTLVKDQLDRDIAVIQQKFQGLSSAFQGIFDLRASKDKTPAERRLEKMQDDDQRNALLGAIRDAKTEDERAKARRALAEFNLGKIAAKERETANIISTIKTDHFQIDKANLETFLTDQNNTYGDKLKALNGFIRKYHFDRSSLMKEFGRKEGTALNRAIVGEFKTLIPSLQRAAKTFDFGLILGSGLSSGAKGFLRKTKLEDQPKFQEFVQQAKNLGVSKEFVNAMSGLGVDASGGFETGFRKSIRNFRREVPDLFHQGVFKPAVAYLETQSPSKRFARLGRFVVDGFVKGLETFKKKFATAFAGVGTDIAAFFTSVYKFAKGNSGWGRLVAFLTGGVIADFPKIRRTLNTLWDGLLGDTQTFWRRFKKTITDAWKEVKTVLTTDIPSSFDQIGQSFGRLWTRLGHGVNRGWNYIANTLFAWEQNVVKTMNLVIQRVGGQKVKDITQPSTPSVSAPTGFASGGVPTVGRTGYGIVRPVPGGVYRVAEAGAREAIISLDPRYRKRSLDIIDYALNHLRVPGFAKGGVVDPSDSGEPRFAGIRFPHIPRFDEVSGVIKDVALKAAKLVRDAANTWFSDKILSSVTAGGRPTGPSPIITDKHRLQNVELGKYLARKKYGWSGGEFEALYRLWIGESGWNEYAYNASSGAQGIPQFLPMPGRTTPKGFPSRPPVDPRLQELWGMDYIRGRYTTPSQAYNLWLARSPHWYHSGGEVRGSAGQNIPAVLQSGEYVLTNQHRTLLRDLFAPYISSGSSGRREGPYPKLKEIEERVLKLLHSVFNKISGRVGGSFPRIQFHGDTDYYTRTRIHNGLGQPLSRSSRVIDIGRRALLGMFNGSNDGLGAILHEFAHAFQSSETLRRGRQFFEPLAQVFMQKVGPSVYQALKIPFNANLALVPQYARLADKLRGTYGRAVDSIALRNQFVEGDGFKRPQVHHRHIELERRVRREAADVKRDKDRLKVLLEHPIVNADKIADVRKRLAHDKDQLTEAEKALAVFEKKHPHADDKFKGVKTGIHHRAAAILRHYHNLKHAAGQQQAVLDYFIKTHPNANAIDLDIEEKLRRVIQGIEAHAARVLEQYEQVKGTEDDGGKPGQDELDQRRLAKLRLKEQALKALMAKEQSRLVFDRRALSAFKDAHDMDHLSKRERDQLQGLHDRYDTDRNRFLKTRVVYKELEAEIRRLLRRIREDDGGNGSWPPPPQPPPRHYMPTGQVFAEGGMVKGSFHGAPVPVTAHVGEWVVNDEQQERLARVFGSWQAAKQFLFETRLPDAGQAFAAGGVVSRPTGGSVTHDGRATVNLTVNTSSPKADIDYIMRAAEKRMSRGF